MLKYNVTNEANMLTNEEKMWIKNNCYDKFGGIIKRCSHITWWKKKNAVDLYNKIVSKVDNYYNFPCKIHLILEDKKGKYCPVCGKPMSLARTTCSVQCCKQYGVRTKKMCATKLERYGSIGYNNKVKGDQTKLEKYGSSTYNNRESFKKTCLEKYGTKTPGENIEVKNKIISTKRKKYADENPQAMEIFNDTEIMKKILENEGVYGVMKATGASLRKTLNVLIDCGLHIPNSAYSHIEKTVVNYIKSIYSGEIITNDRKILHGKEIDIYIPEKKIAFEIDGVYWHSLDKYNSTYHLDKTLGCEAKGIQLYHIFDIELYEKRDIWYSVIQNALGACDRKIGARQCVIAKIPYQTAYTFCEENHLQGVCQSSYNVGLFYNDELVSIMTFGKSRFNKQYDWELLRFCVKKNTIVIGAASRLFHYFRKSHSGSIISYANRRWSQGNLYKKLGFQKVSTSPPNYFYWKCGESTLLSRNKCQKHKLSNILQSYNSNETEYENMLKNGYRRLYDCGNFVFVQF